MYHKKLNVCLLLPDFFDPNMPARPAITEIYGKYLPSFGNNVTWITPSFKDSIQIKYFNKVKVYTVPYIQSSHILLKVLNFIRYQYKKYILLNTIIAEEKQDIIQVRNDVYSALIALYIRRKYKIPIVFQYSFPKYKIQKSMKKHTLVANKFENVAVKYILHNADFIFPISKWMESKLTKEGLSKSKMMPLSMGVNPDLFDFKKDGSNVRQKYLSSDSKLLLYLGSMDKLRSLDLLIHSFSNVKETHPNTKMLMVGDGNDRERLEKLSLELGLQQSIIFTGQVPYFDVPNYISASDICLSPIRPLDIYKVSSPTKLFESMVMCKPVVANKEIPEQKEVIEQSGGGILVDFKPESFANGIIELLENSEAAKEMGENGYKWVIENRSYESMAHDVEKQFYKLLESSGDLQQ